MNLNGIVLREATLYIGGPSRIEHPILRTLKEIDILRYNVASPGKWWGHRFHYATAFLGLTTFNRTATLARLMIKELPP